MHAKHAAAANELTKLALFELEVAKHLLNRPVKEILIPGWTKKLSQLMGWALAERESEQD